MSAARKSLQTLVSHLLIFVQALLLTPIVIKVAGPETYGAYVLLSSYMSLVFGVSSLGMGISAKRWLPSTPEASSRALLFYPQFWFQVTSVIILALFSAIAYATLFAENSGSIERLAPWMIPVYLLSYTVHSQVTDYFRYTHSVGVFNLSTITQPYLAVLIVITVYWATNTLSISSLVGAATFASALVGVTLFRKLYREIGGQLTFPRRYELAAEIKMGLPLVFSYLVDVLLAGADRYIIAAILSIRDVGIYVPAYALGSLVIVLPKVFGVVLTPLIAQRIDAGDDAGAKRLSDGASKLFLIAALPYLAGAAILGKDVLRLYTTDEVSSAAWPVISIVAFASIYYGLMLLRANILFVRMQTSVLFKINLICAILNIGLNFLFLQLFGNVVVSAVATLVSYGASYTLLCQKLKGDSANIGLSWNWIIRIILCAVAMALVLLIQRGDSETMSPTSLALLVATGGSIYTLLILAHKSNRIDLALLIRALTAR